ncbi:aminotransferase class I/II-fold pyridoxal phosphate-dependent enzyme, partial [Candidatus Woesearchaeota archaeon]
RLSKSHINSMLKKYNARRKVIVPRLNEMGLSTPVPKGAFYAFSDISHLSNDSRKFSFDLLSRMKVAVVPGVDFGKRGEGHIRLSFAAKLPIIERALDRIEKFVKSYDRR